MGNVPSHVFRGYDIRGVYKKDFAEDEFKKLGKGYGTFLQKRRIRKAVVGHDTRLSSPTLQKAFVEGLIETGVDVINIGLTLTQIMYFAQYRYLSKGGAIITASHNEKQFNGMKLAVGFSDTLISQEIQELREIVQNEEFYESETKGTVEDKDVFPEYKKYILSLFPNQLDFKLVVDGLYGATGKFLPEILREAGCEVIERQTELNGEFPAGTPDPTERHHQEALGKAVIEAKVNAGFSYDSDGDRIGIVDAEGNIIWNDVLVAIFAKDVIEQSPESPIVYNVLCTKAVEDTIQSVGGKSVMWLTGHSFIKAKVKEERALFGGELSGHFFFMDNFFGHDDGAYATLRLLDYLQRHGKTLAQEVATIPEYISSPEIKVGCPDKIKFETVSKTIGDKIKNRYPNAEYVEIDGIRADWDSGMVVIRASQNGPYLTTKFEAKTRGEYDKIKAVVKEILESVEEIDMGSGVNTDSLE